MSRSRQSKYPSPMAQFRNQLKNENQDISLSSSGSTVGDPSSTGEALQHPMAFDGPMNLYVSSLSLQV
jgi:hypothetical protein